MQKESLKVELCGVRDAVNKVFPEDMNKDNTVFLCIGTDRSTGDSFAPLVGSNLKKHNFMR